jgi:hypothetical protein
MKSYEKLMPDSIAKFEIIGKMFILITPNQIKMKESCTNQSST